MILLSLRGVFPFHFILVGDVLHFISRHTHCEWREPEPNSAERTASSGVSWELFQVTMTQDRNKWGALGCPMCQCYGMEISTSYIRLIGK